MAFQMWESPPFRAGRMSTSNAGVMVSSFLKSAPQWFSKSGHAGWKGASGSIPRPRRCSTRVQRLRFGLLLM